jgi:hypothetical protein
MDNIKLSKVSKVGWDYVYNSFWANVTIFAAQPQISSVFPMVPYRLSTQKKRWNLGTVRSWKSRVQLCWWSPQFLAPERGLHSQNMLIMVTKSGSYSRSVHLKWPVWPPKKIIHDRLGLCRLCQIFQQTFQTLCPSPLLRTCLFPARLLWRAWRMPSAQPSPGFSREHQPHIRKSSSKFPFDSCKPKKWTWKLSSFPDAAPPPCTPALPRPLPFLGSGSFHRKWLVSSLLSGLPLWSIALLGQSLKMQCELALCF